MPFANLVVIGSMQLHIVNDSIGMRLPDFTALSYRMGSSIR